MKFMNLHCHSLDISIFKNNAFIKTKTENDVVECDVFAISCNNCLEIYYDYNSNFTLNINSITKNTSLFCKIFR